MLTSCVLLNDHMPNYNRLNNFSDLSQTKLLDDTFGRRQSRAKCSNIIMDDYVLKCFAKVSK